jgi:hypothetical protein
MWGTDKPPGQADPYGKDSSVSQWVESRNAKSGQKQQGKSIDGDKPVEVRVKHNNVFDDTYEPADTWEGLGVVGDVPQKQYYFEGFIPARKSLTQVEAEMALRRAVVETLVAKEAGLPLSNIYAGPVDYYMTGDIQITVADGRAHLQFPEGVTAEDVIQSFSPVVDETAVKTDPTDSEEDVAADRSTVDPLHPEEEKGTPVDETAVKSDPTESEEDVAADRSTVDPLEDEHIKARVASWDPVWKSIALADAEVKFAVSIFLSSYKTLTDHA